MLDPTARGSDRRLRPADPRVTGLRFRRNFGKAAALSAGFAQSRGELVMTLDADLSGRSTRNSPLPRRDRERSWTWSAAGNRCGTIRGHKVLPSRVFNWMVSRLTGVKTARPQLRHEVLSPRRVARGRLYGELHRFVPVLAAARGFRVGETVINHRPRRFGRSKYE